MKNNIYTAIPDWFNKVQSQSTDNTSTTTTQTTIIGGGGSISMSVHNLFIKSDTTITIDDFTISDLFVTDQITDTENWLTTPLLHTLPNTEVSVTTAAQQLYIGAYDKNNNQIKLYQFSEAISTVVIPENCYYLRASSNKTNTDLTIKYVGLNNFDETQQNKLESSSFQNFLTLVEGDEKGVITNSVQNLSLVFQNPLYYTLDKAGNVLISIDRDALFSQSENPTDDRYVTTVANSVQDILSSKNFKEGLSINGIEIVERNGFLYIKGNLATTGGITAYTDDPDDPGGSGGLPGGGAIGDIVITGSGNALVDASLSEDHSVITFTKGWLVDAESDQSITGIKDFINGLKLSGQLIKIVDGVLFLDCSIAATGGITAYATMPGEGSSSIMDQLVVDTKYFIITEEGVLTIVPGSVGGISNIYVTGDGNALTTATLSEDGKTISFTKDKNFADQAEMSAYKSEVNQTIAEFKNEVNEQLKHFVTLDTEQEITAIKHFIEGVTIGSNKHKFYEKDGVLWLEGDIAITGGITTYATENVDVSTIMDGVTVDEITITKGSDNILRIKNAGTGSSFDENTMWSALASSSDKQINKSHLTTALTGYATESWVTSKNYAVKATTLAGYGITDAYTKTESDNKYPTKTGSGASGTWEINITGNAVSSSKSNTIAIDRVSNLNSPNWNEYAATIQRFDANADNRPPVGDNANAVLNIPMTKHGTSGMYGYQLAFVSNREEIYARKWSSGNPTIWKLLPFVDYNTGYLRYGFSSVLSTDWFRSEGNTGWYSQTYGGGIYMTDSNYIRTLNNKAFCALRYDADQGSLGQSWNNGQGAFSVRIYNDNNQTPLLLAYRNATNDTGANRLFAMELLNNGNQLNFGMGGESRLELQKGYLTMNGTFRANGDVYGNRLIYKDITSTTLSAGDYFLSNQPAIKCEQDLAIVDNDRVRPILRWGDAVKRVGYNTRYVIGSVRYGYDWGRIFMAVSNNDAGTSVGCSMSIYGSGYVEVTGNILSTGGITAYSSDVRAKNIIENIELSLKQISEAPTVRFKWNGWKLEDDGKTHIGGLAQYTQKVLPEAVLNTNDFLNMDYATTGYIFAVHTARHLLDYETKTDKEIRKLKNRIKYLEKQLKSLHYEEANIVDN